MKSGLYACAGASATASAAAWAKRFDEPITKRSNVYFGFRPDSRPLRGAAAWRRRDLRGAGLGDGRAASARSLAGRVAHARRGSARGNGPRSTRA